MKNSISIDFGTPAHGWLPVNLHHDDFLLSFYASDVLNDPIDELLKALLGLDNKLSKEIIWWLEPGAYFFYLEKKDSNFILTISETEDLHRNADKRNIIKTIIGGYIEIVEPFKKAINQFGSNVYEDENWPYIIDKERLRQLNSSKNI